MSVGQGRSIRARQGKMERWCRRTDKAIDDLKKRLEQRRKAKERK